MWPDEWDGIRLAMSKDYDLVIAPSLSSEWPMKPVYIISERRRPNMQCVDRKYPRSRQKDDGFKTIAAAMKSVLGHTLSYQGRKRNDYGTLQP